MIAHCTVLVVALVLFVEVTDSKKVQFSNQNTKMIIEK